MDKNFQNLPPIEGDQHNIFKRHKKGILLAALGILIFMLVASTLPFRSQLFSSLFPKQLSKAFSELPFIGERTVAKVGGKTITAKDLEKEFIQRWGHYAQKEPVENYSQKLTEDLIRKEIIAQEAQKLGISVSPSDIDKKVAEEMEKAGGETQYLTILAGNGWSEDDARKKLEEQILEEKVKMKVVAWRLIDGVSAYLDPLSETYPEQKQVVINSLTKASSSLSDGNDIFQAQVKAAGDQDVIKKFGLTVSRKIEKGGWDSKIFEGILKLRKGEVSQVLISNSGASFWVVKVIDGNDSSFTKFEDWLESKRGEYVR